MKKLILLPALFLAACASKPPQVETKLQFETPLTNQTVLGVRDGDIVVQRKVNMAEELRALQIEVATLEKETYGDENNRGIYGVLKDCRKERAIATTGDLQWTEPRDLVMQERAPASVGFDERQVLVGFTEEKLQANLDRFGEYKSVLERRRDDLKLKLDRCEIDTARGKVAGQ